MKLFLKVSVLSLVAILVCGKIIAQTPDTARASGNYFKPFSADNIFRTWSVGVNTGLLSFSNILQRDNKLDFTSPSSKIGYGFYVKKQILPLLGVEGQVFAGSLSSANSQQTTNGDPDYLNVNSTLRYAASLNFIFSFASLNWHYNNLGVQPFVGLGLGMMSYHPKLLGIDAADTGFVRIDAGSTTSVFIPARIGLKFNVSHSVNIDIAYQENFALSDKVDGNVYGTSNDKFSYLNLGLEFALGKRSKRQMVTYGTVPTRYAHVSVKKTKPTANKTNNKTTNKAAVDTVKTNDVAGQPNHDEFNRRLKSLSLDSDSDGVSDYFDRCPNTPRGVVVDESGCPIVEVNGKVKGALSESDKQIIADAAKSVEFENGKASLNKASFEPLNRLADLLIAKKLNANLPTQVLILSGHSDDYSSELANLSLSRQRAEAIKSYLVRRGVKESNIITVGYGNETPANSTNMSLKASRRVEFTLY